MATSTLLVIFFIVTVLMLIETQCWYINHKRTDSLNNKMLMEPEKRPFCNAFTGCEGKRSQLPALPAIEEPNQEEESIGSLLELSAEPAVEDISRQIMSEAKLWEAIQEANVELNRRKQASAEETENHAPGMKSHPVKSVAGTCALPPCYI